MARKRSTPPKQLSHRWHLLEWAKLAGKSQADAQRELGWPKSTASELWNGNQRYTQDLIDEVARWLEIQPHELLMPPKDAIALRRLREAAAEIMAENQAEFEIDRPLEPDPPRPRGHPKGPGRK